MKFYFPMFLICLLQFTLAVNEDRVKVGIIIQKKYQTNIVRQIDKRIKQSISNYLSVEIHEVQMDTTYQTEYLFEMMLDQRELDHIFIPCYISDNQINLDECTFYWYDVENSIESTYTFSLKSINPKSMVAYLDQQYILPIFSTANPWISRILIFGSIVGVFYLAQTWIDVDFSGTSKIDSDQGGGSH